MDRGDGKLLIVHPFLIPLYSHPCQNVPSNFVKKNKRLLARSGKIILLLCFSYQGTFLHILPFMEQRISFIILRTLRVTVSEYFVIVVFGRDSDFNS